MPRASKLGKTYPAWLKSWRKAGAPAWPEVANFISVRWTDAAFSHEDSGTLGALLGGFLKDANEKEITLAMECFEDGEQRTFITVPAGMVNRVFDIATIRAFAD